LAAFEIGAPTAYEVTFGAARCHGRDSFRASPMNIDKVLAWWAQGVYFALCVSFFMLGVGRLESSSGRASISAWSVSRTTFFFWLVWKIITTVRERRLTLARGRHGISRPLLLFFIAVTLSLLPDFHGANDYRYFFFASMHFLMIVDLCADEKKARPLLIVLGITPLILVIRGILHDPMLLDMTQVMPLDITQLRRFGYPSDHPNIIGYLFSMTIPLSLAIAMGEAGKLRVLALLSCLAQLLALALTYSRGAWLGWGAAMAFLVVTMKRRREAAVILVAAALIAVFFTPLQSRLSSLFSPRSDLSISDRVQVIEATLKLAWANPILGVGYGRDRLREGLRENRLEMRRIAHTHSVYVELLATTGFVGLASFLWLICQGFTRALRNARHHEGAHRALNLGFASAWIAFAVTGLGDVPFYHHETRILFFSLLALTYLYCRDSDTERSAEKA
jgi:O-antigen ligase